MFLCGTGRHGGGACCHGRRRGRQCQPQVCWSTTRACKLPATIRRRLPMCRLQICNAVYPHAHGVHAVGLVEVGDITRLASDAVQPKREGAGKSSCILPHAVTHLTIAPPSSLTTVRKHTIPVASDEQGIPWPRGTTLCRPLLCLPRIAPRILWRSGNYKLCSRCITHLSQMLIHLLSRRRLSLSL